MEEESEKRQSWKFACFGHHEKSFCENYEERHV